MLRPRLCALSAASAAPALALAACADGADLALRRGGRGRGRQARLAGDQQAPVEVTTDGPGGLSYDAATGQYTCVWKTSTALAGRCGRLELGLGDGSDRYALFRFTR